MKTVRQMVDLCDECDSIIAGVLCASHPSATIRQAFIEVCDPNTPTSKESKETKMTCQFLYDLRTLTGFISGSELHDLFRALVGDPSPSGYIPISLARAEELCPELTRELDRSPQYYCDGLSYKSFREMGPEVLEEIVTE